MNYFTPFKSNNHRDHIKTFLEYDDNAGTQLKRVIECKSRTREPIIYYVKDGTLNHTPIGFIAVIKEEEILDDNKPNNLYYSLEYVYTKPNYLSYKPANIMVNRICSVIDIDIEKYLVHNDKPNLLTPSIHSSRIDKPYYEKYSNHFKFKYADILVS